jgi:CRP/FNR family cyclic AMP-dependent transcriptional regulator
MLDFYYFNTQALLKDAFPGMTKFTTHLKQTDIFHGFTPTQLELVANLCSETDFDQGEIIFYENSDRDELYIIIQGKVDILIHPNLISDHPESEMEPITIARLKKGQSFGEIALVDRGARSATAQAAQNKTRLLFISSQKLMALCDTYPNLGYRLMHNLAADLAFKIRNTDMHIRENIYYRRLDA